MVEATDESEDDAEKDGGMVSMFTTVDCLTKGIEVPLPDGHDFKEKDGHVRTRVRVRRWAREATTFRRAAMLSDVERAGLPGAAIPAYALLSVEDVPVFFGHYWLTGTPALQSPSAVCVDYSAGVGGPLVGYRFDGERLLSADKLVWV